MSAEEESREHGDNPYASTSAFAAAPIDQREDEVPYPGMEQYIYCVMQPGKKRNQPDTPVHDQPKGPEVEPLERVRRIAVEENDIPKRPVDQLIQVVLIPRVPEPQQGQVQQDCRDENYRESKEICVSFQEGSLMGLMLHAGYKRAKALKIRYFPDTAACTLRCHPARGASF